FKAVAALGAAVAKVASDTVSEVGKAAKALAAKLDSVAGDSLVEARQAWDARPATWSFVDLNGEFAIELTAQDNADHAPTRAALAVARSSCDELRKRSEEHTSELQSRFDLVCRLLLEKKKNKHE